MRRDEESEINSDKDKVSHNVQSDHKYIPYLTIPTFKGPGENAFRKLCGKKENGSKQHDFFFSFSRNVFHLIKDRNHHFSNI